MKDLNLMLGRLNAVHAAICVICGSLPQSVAQVAAPKMRESTERVHADALALPIADGQVQEMHRVMAELTTLLESAAQGQK